MMVKRSLGVLALGAGVALCAAWLAPARAQDFFSSLFGGFSAPRHSPPRIVMPFGYDGEWRGAPRSRVSYGGGQAFCVRSCDGRYFPITGPDNQSRAASCSAFCPAAETKLVYGSSIDDAATEAGKPYSELPNAFRFRNEIVGGCTCDGRDPVGLAKIEIEKDPTLRKGDIVAGPNGLVVANGSADRRGTALNFSPAPERLRAKYRHVPVVARQ
jgi:hypothetical protein